MRRPRPVGARVSGRKGNPRCGTTRPDRPPQIPCPAALGLADGGPHPVARRRACLGRRPSRTGHHDRRRSREPPARHPGTQPSRDAEASRQRTRPGRHPHRSHAHKSDRPSRGRRFRAVELPDPLTSSARCAGERTGSRAAMRSSSSPRRRCRPRPWLEGGTRRVADARHAAGAGAVPACLAYATSRDAGPVDGSKATGTPGGFNLNLVDFLSMVGGNRSDVSQRPTTLECQAWRPELRTASPRRPTWPPRPQRSPCPTVGARRGR